MVGRITRNILLHSGNVRLDMDPGSAHGRVDYTKEASDEELFFA